MWRAVTRQRSPGPAGLLIALVVILTTGHAFAHAGPLVGGYHDDGIYVVSARSLAESGRYQVASLPESVAQTKYPPMFPAALALVWKVFPAFPQNVSALRVVPWLCLWGWMYVVWLIVAAELRRKEAAVWIILLTVAAPMTMYFATRLMSETMFALFGTWAVLLMMRVHTTEGPTAVQLMILLAVTCTLAFYTRTIGITLLPPAVYVFLVRREYRCLIAFVSLFLVLAAPWLVWQAVHATPADPVVAYYTKANYSSWNLITGGSTAPVRHVAAENLAHLLASPARLWAVPFSAITVLLSISTFIIVVGIGIASLWTRAAAVGAWVLSTIPITLLWMWPPSRFMLPVMPMAMLLCLLPFSRPGLALQWCGRVIAILLLSSAVIHAARAERPSCANDSRCFSEAQVRAELSATLNWIDEFTEAGAVISGNLDPMYWLYTGRKAIRSFVADPYHLFYSDGANEISLGSALDLRLLLARHRVSHLIVEDMPLFAETRPLARQVESVREQWPDILQPVWRSPRDMVTIYAVRAR